MNTQLLIQKSLKQEILKVTAGIQSLRVTISAQWNHFNLSNYFNQLFLAAHNDGRYIIKMNTPKSIWESVTQTQTNVVSLAYDKEIINFQLASPLPNIALRASHNVRHEL